MTAAAKAAVVQPPAAQPASTQTTLYPNREVN